MLSNLLVRIRALFRRNTVEGELDDELRFHFDQQVEKLVQSGVDLSEARRRARLLIGGSEIIKEECRDERGVSIIETFLHDIRFGLRLLVKDPRFAVFAILTLALGIAVNATMFSLVSAFLLRRPPGHKPDRVAIVTSVNPTPGYLPDTNPVSAPNYLAWREGNHVFADLAAADEFRHVSLTLQGESEALRSAAVTSNYFSLIGVSAEFGRTFYEGEDQPGRDHVVILSHELWERHFGADPNLIDRTVRLNRENYTVIGVMPSSFRLMGFTPQLWTPLVLTASDQTSTARKDRSLFLFARLKPSVTLEEARAEIVTLARRAESNFPETEKGWSAAVRTLPDFLVYYFGIRSGLSVMMTTVVFVLMIACANVAGLLLARASGRRKELAIRIALGAARLRIIRQLLTENLVIALFGGGLGLLLSYWGINFMRAKLNFNEAISAVPPELDWRVLLFTLGVSLICALLCGLAPALHASRTNINTTLKDEGRAAIPGRSQTRLRTIFVTVEIALALCLLIGTGLLIHGVSMVDRQSLGFQPQNLLTANVTLDSARYKGAAEQALFVKDVIPRILQIPGVEFVAATSDLPATGAGDVNFRIKSQPHLPVDQSLNAFDFVVTNDFFRAAEIPLLRGRAFTELDNAAAPRVVVVNQEFVRRFLKDAEPLGQQIRTNLSSAAPEWIEIVGVVGDMKTYSGDTREKPQIFEPFLQRPIPAFSLMLRASSNPESFASALRSAVAQVDAELPFDRIMTMSAIIERQRGGDSFFLSLLGAFAILALFLAAIGIYGLVAYSVGQRTHEIGIRLALGAGNPDVLRMILWDGVKITIIGTAVGILLSLPLPKLFDAMFDGIRFHQPWLYIIVPVAILMIAMFATYIPARRASRVDPMMALRYE